MKAVIFGTGNLYEDFKAEFRNDIEIIAFLDNDSKKHGEYIDGIQILSPENIKELEYDFVFTLSVYHLEMRLQLEELGVEPAKIYNMYYLERILKPLETKSYGNQINNTDTKEILVISHALTSTGAQNVLFTALCVLKELGYYVTVFSRSDGPLKEKLLEKGINVVINRDFNIEDDKIKYIIKKASLVIVNTIWLHEVVNKLSNIHPCILWWIHETTGMKYVKRELLLDFEKRSNISIYVISNTVKQLMYRHYNCNLDLNVLSCGICPQIEINRNCFSDKKVIFAIIGTLDSSVKGQDVFIRAVELLDEEYRRKAEFQLIGYGHLKPIEMDRISKLDCMKVIGGVDNSQIGKTYEKLDVVVSCSRVEALSVVIIEGSMYKRLVIASDAAGIAEYIDDGTTGFVFKSEDAKKLAEIIRWVIDNREGARVIAEEGYSIYYDNFRLSKFTDSFKRVITSKIG